MFAAVGSATKTRASSSDEEEKRKASSSRPSTRTSCERSRSTASSESKAARRRDRGKGRVPAMGIDMNPVGASGTDALHHLRFRRASSSGFEELVETGSRFHAEGERRRGHRAVEIEHRDVAAALGRLQRRRSQHRRGPAAAAADEPGHAASRAAGRRVRGGTVRGGTHRFRRQWLRPGSR